MRNLKAGGGVLKLGRPKGLSRSNVRAPVSEVVEIRSRKGLEGDDDDWATGAGLEADDDEGGIGRESDEDMVDLE